ncbi:MAG TPA: hypothetical protein PKW79_00355 [Rhabdochlamydiaceae bacterium]|nr:hypothetical protein [Rhabdochlamydiaceae bacterium]
MQSRNQKTFKTPSGTELKLLNLKGKDYLGVAERIHWFREDHPSWTIQTELIHWNEKFTIIKASVLDESGRVLSVGTKSQQADSFDAFIEKAETGAIGRCLANLGYGTLHALELEENPENLKELADSPIAPADAYVLPCGLLRGSVMQSLSHEELQGILDFYYSPKGKTYQSRADWQDMIKIIEMYLETQRSESA